MASLVGGAFLSATVQTLVEKLASKEFRDYIKNTKLNESLLRELGTTLLILQTVLDDAEEKQIINPSVKQWLDQLKDAIFDAEDLLDQISTGSLRCKVENTEAGNITGQVWNFLSSPFKNFYGEINSQMKDMCQRLQLFAQQRDILGLQAIRGRVSRRMPTTSMVNQSVMVGRKDDKEKLVNLLLSDNGTSNNNNNIGVVTILGMGGVGKTALAQLLYNNKEVQEHFEPRAWACVSEDFDVTKTLLESVTSRASGTDNLDLLRVELKQNLMGKRFLFVMDDLWNDKYNDWDELLTPLVDGKIGSKVIITTRQEKVAEVTHTLPIHKLEPLSVEDCWCLLSKHAFGTVDSHGSEFQNLEAIGKKIANKCGGLPIAAKTLGGLLRTKADANEWTTILNSNIWDLPMYRNITVLPDSLGNLVQLRYLDLSHTGIKCLPDTTCNLYNLQTLILSGCYGVTELPLHIGKLVNLRHLDISGMNIRELPMQIVGLENLRSLTAFVVGKQEVGLSVECLGSFLTYRENFPS